MQKATTVSSAASSSTPISPTTPPPSSVLIYQTLLDIKDKGIITKVAEYKDVKSKNQKKKKRTVKLDNDENYVAILKTAKTKLFRFGGSKKPKNIPLREITAVVPNATKDGFSLVTTTKTYDIFCNTFEEAKRYISALSFLVEHANLEVSKDPMGLVILKQWLKADKNGDGKLDYKEIKALSRMLNMNIPKKVLKAKFAEFDVDNSNYFDYDEFVKFYTSLMERKDIEALFHQITGGKSMLYADTLLKFTMVEQREKYKFEDCEKIIATYASPAFAEKKAMSVYNFVSFLMSPENMIVDPQIYQLDPASLNRPLSDYYIASSHNTYLVGNQLTGESSVEMYKKVLLMGCRCVELDVWDGPKGQPIIYHGHTLTSKISFEDVLECINTFAFEASKYPVILSIENHCSIEQQIEMAKLFIKVFDRNSQQIEVFEDGDVLPSPASMMGKILIKGKRLPIHCESAKVTTPTISTEALEDEEDDDEDDDEDEKPEVAETSQKAEPVLAVKPAAAPQKKKVEHHKIATVLSSKTCFGGIKFSSFPESMKKRAYQMHSFSENKLRKLMKRDLQGLFAYNRRMLARVYPKGVRFDSSNYDPVPPMSVGCQLVALNYQTFDDYMRFYQSIFQANGGCGYLLKPSILTDPKSSFNSLALSQPVLKIKLKIMSGFMIPKPNQSAKGEIVDPFVKVSILGLPADEQSVQTERINDNGWNPTWNSKEYEFKICCPDLAYIRFTVYDWNATVANIFLAENTFPVKHLREGYRSVPLRNDRAQLIDGSSVFVYIQKDAI